MSLHEWHIQYSQWINHQLNVRTSDLPQTVISKAKDAAFLFTYHIMRKLPCLSRSTTVFFGKSQHSHTTRSILFSVFTTDQMPEFAFSTYRCFHFSSCSKGTYLQWVWVSPVGASSLFSSFGLTYENGRRKTVFSFFLFQSLLKSKWKRMNGPKREKTRRLHHWTVKIVNVRSSGIFKDTSWG